MDGGGEGGEGDCSLQIGQVFMGKVSVYNIAKLTGSRDWIERSCQIVQAQSILTTLWKVTDESASVVIHFSYLPLCTFLTKRREFS